MTVKHTSRSFQRTEVLPRVIASGYRGITWREIQEDFDPEFEAHHGSISGSLTFLNKDKLILGITESRGGSRVYVHPNFLGGRTIVPPRRNGLSPQEKAYYALLNDLMDTWFEVDETDSRTGVKSTCRAEQFKGLFVPKLKALWENRPVIEP